MKWEHKAVAVGLIAVIGTFFIGDQIEKYQAQSIKNERAAKTTIALKQAPLPTAIRSPNERYSESRGKLIADLQTSLKTGKYHPAIGNALEFEKVADEEFLALLSRARAADEKQSAANLKRLEAENRVAAKKKGVSIGMTREQVKGSSWGRPESVNTTTSAYGSREQWVYGGRNYLYFENGVLVTIQN